MTTDAVRKLANAWTTEHYRDGCADGDGCHYESGFLAGFDAGRKAGLLRGAEIADEHAVAYSYDGMEFLYGSLRDVAADIRDEAEAEAGGGREKG